VTTWRRPDWLANRLNRRINRAPSPILAHGMPWVTVFLASVVPSWLVISSAPILPPVGFLVLLGWRQLRPGLLPIWAGLPLGLLDDLFSGQPLGSAVLLWSLTMILLDIVEARIPWRNFGLEWLMAAGIVAAYILAGLGLANIAGASTSVRVLAPQIIVSILVYPLVARMVAMFDRLRLLPLVRAS